MTASEMISLGVAVLGAAISLAYTAGGVLPRISRLEKDIETKVSCDRFDDLASRLSRIEAKVDALLGRQRD